MRLSLAKLNVLAAAAATLLLAPICARAADVHSNGTGGGAWSDPATWRSHKAPGPGDNAVVSRGDAVAFDRDDDGKPTCDQVSIDPKGVLTFKSGVGKATLSLTGPIDSYGMIRLDGTANATDRFEIRFVGDKVEKRALKLQPGASLVAVGRPGLPNNTQNVAIASKSLPPPPPKPIPPGEKPPAPAATPAVIPPELMATISAGPGNTVDVQRARFVSVVLQALSIDNTGAKPNERVNVASSTFIAGAYVALNSCDTPVVSGNTFDYAGPTVIATPAIHVYGCPLAEVRDNTVTGKFTYGIFGQAQTDSVVAGNTVTGCATGVYWYGANAMFKQNTFRGCDTGVVVTSMSGSLEDTTVEGCKLGVNVASAEAQFTTLRVGTLQKDGQAMDLSAGAVTLVNCNLKPKDIKLGATPPKDKPWVDAMEYLVVAVKGTVPPKTEVEVKTVGWTPPAPGAADLNVRNSPAALGTKGMTPLPQSLKPIIVRSWTIPASKTPTAPPAYTVNVLEAAATQGATRKVLATVSATPAETWFRPNPNEAPPTVEVKIP